MRLARAFPLLVLGLGLATAGCQGIPLGKRSMPMKDGEVLEKLEARSPAQDKLPEIVALPPITPAPAMAPAPKPAPPMFAAAKPEVAMRPTRLEDDDVPVRHLRHTPKPPKGGKMHVGARGGHGKTYTVRRGDTLQKISQKMYGTTKNWQKIYDANKSKMKRPDVVVVGTVLTIP